MNAMPIPFYDGVFISVTTSLLQVPALDRLVIRVKEVRGRCTVFKGGEKITVEGAEVNLRETDKICIHALASLLHYLVALREGVDPVRLGLSKVDGKAYIQCLDPGEPYTNGGTVIFEVSKDQPIPML
jgi:uncharacterized repeat protein (TIGR04076 family)